mgnify:CR=1 FL=1
MKYIAQSAVALCHSAGFVFAAPIVHSCIRNVTFDVTAIHLGNDTAAIFIGFYSAFSCTSPAAAEVRP